MSILEGRALGRVTFVWPTIVKIVERADVLGANRREMFRGDVYIRCRDKHAVFIGDNAAELAHCDAIYDSVVSEDVDIVWDLRGEVPRRTPDRGGRT